MPSYPHRVPLAFLGLSLLPALCAAQTPLHDRAPLRFGPLIGGQDVRLDWRSGVPSGTTLFFLSLSSTPTPLPTIAAPALALPLSSPFLVLQTDGSGRLRLELPTVPGQFAAGAGLRIATQAVTVAPGGQIVVSNPAVASLEAGPMAGPIFEDASASLPASATDLAGIFARAGDLDGDGYPDLVVSNGVGVELWTNDGLGNFQAAVSALLHPGDAVSALALADVDGDGDLDLVTGGGFDASNTVPDRLWRNQGNGSFLHDPLFPAGSGQSSDFGFGDFDGDGDLDLVVTSGPEGHLFEPGGLDRIYRNDGTGLFSEYAGFLNPSWNDTIHRTTSVAIGDVDNDGDLDLFLTKNGVHGGARNVLLSNDGTGRFAEVTGFAMPGMFSDRSAHAVFADLDGDGDLDLVVANTVLSVPTSASNDVWINQGGLQGGIVGFFADDGDSFLEPLHLAPIRLRVRAVDVDADGDVDVFLGTHDFFPPAPQLLFLNQGGRQGGVEGEFLRDFSFQPGNFVCGDLVAFDGDGDGDLELLMVANGALGGSTTGQFATRYLRSILP